MEALILILIVIILVLLCKRTFSSVIYATIIVDLFLHLLDYININLLKIEVLYSIPSGFVEVINNNTKGVLNTVLIYLLVLIYIIFEGYIIKYFIRKR